MIQYNIILHDGGKCQKIDYTFYLQKMSVRDVYKFFYEKLTILWRTSTIISMG